MGNSAIDRLNAALEGRYRIESELGEGGMATVYLADDLRHARKVALKVLRSDLSVALGAERFLREIQIAARLQHPHVLPLHDSGEAEGHLYYVMPFVEGESLRQRIAREGELPIGDTVRILRHVVDALTEAHAHGVVHRDIKPENVLLRGRHALVADFGVAKAVSEATGRQHLTTMGVSLGTPAYMAPEQAAADPHVDHRVDIYAVGVMAYELLAGRQPFEGKTPHQMLAAHVTERPRPVAEHRAAVPPALASVVMKCLEKRPADRWQSAEDLLSQLEVAVTPSGGTTPTGMYPVSVAEHRRGWGIPAALALALLLALGYATITSRARSEGEPTLATLRQLTANPLQTALTGAAISPDGTYLAFTDPTGLYVQTIATGEVTARELPDGMVAASVGWFPDGTRLYFLGGERRGRLDLFSLPLLGGGPIVVSRAALRAAVSPDGSTFAVIRAAEAGGQQFREIWTMGPRGEDARLSVEAEPGDAFWDLAWSPDSRRLAVGLAPARGPPRIDALALADSERTTLVEDALLFQSWTGVLPFVWCGDGRLVYSLVDGRRSESTSNIWTVQTDIARGVASGRARRATQLAGSNVRGLSSTADCSAVAAMLVENQADVWVAELAADGTMLGGEVQVTFDERADLPVAWGFDGELIVRSARLGSEGLFRWRPGERGLRPLVAGERPIAWGAWSASARRFVYMSGGLWSVGADGGVGVRLTEGAVGEIECALRGGCVAARADDLEVVFSALDVVTGELRELVRIDQRPPFMNFALSPDGATAAVVHLNDDVIRLVDLGSGGETTLRVEGWSLFEFLSWSADGTKIFVNAGFTSSGAYPVLLAVELDGSVHVLRERPNVWHVYPEASPDGRYIAFGAMPFQGNAWLLTDF